MLAKLEYNIHLVQMRIYINGRFLTKPITGVDRFAIEICKQLKATYPDRICILAPHNVVDENLAEMLDVKYVGRHSGYFWEQIELPIYLHSKGNPILVNLCNVAPAIYKRNIITVHDVIWKRYPESFKCVFRLLYNVLIPFLCKHALHIFTVSEFSKKDISECYNIDPHKISVVHNAVSDIFICGNKDEKEDFFLTVSSGRKYKNISVTIKAFNQYCLRNGTGKLYIVGNIPGDMNELIQSITSNPRIKVFGRITDTELVNLYHKAKGFIFPSLYEGFGIPVIEAQACGTAVVASNAASLPEVLGDSALLCDPLDTNAFAKAMEVLFNDTDLNDSLVRRGLSNVMRFSWHSSAEMVWNNLRKYME